MNLGAADYVCKLAPVRRPRPRAANSHRSVAAVLLKARRVFAASLQALALICPTRRLLDRFESRRRPRRLYLGDNALTALESVRLAVAVKVMLSTINRWWAPLPANRVT